MIEYDPGLHLIQFGADQYVPSVLQEHTSEQALELESVGQGEQDNRDTENVFAGH